MSESTGHRRTRSTLVGILGGGSQNSQNNPPVSSRHSVHGPIYQTVQSDSQFLDIAEDSGEHQNRKGGRSSASSVKAPSIAVSSKEAVVPEEPSEESSTNSLQAYTSATKPPGKSVQETVKTFRLYEALRHGDTAFISKTLRGVPNSSNTPEAYSIPAAARNQILHLAVQCAELAVIEYILGNTSPYPPQPASVTSLLPYLDINARDSTGNTPLHIATLLGRTDVVTLLLSQPVINDSLYNFQGKTALELARSPALFEKLDLAKTLFIEQTTARLLSLIDQKAYADIEALLNDERVKGWVDINTVEVSATGFGSSGTEGSTLLHEAARKKDTTLIQLLLLHGADPFKRDKKGKLPQDVTKDEKVKAVLKKSPAATHAQRGIEEKAVLGVNIHGNAGGDIGGEQAREMKGYLKKWTNYTSGWKLRWFVLEDGVLSYYKHQDDIGSACRGAINMRIAKLHMDPQDKTRFEIHGKSSVKYHLKANHVVEAKRWYWTLNNAIQWAKDEAREEERRKANEAERLERLKELTLQQQKNASSTELENSTASLNRGKTAGSARTGTGSTSDLVRVSTAGSEMEFVDAPGDSNSEAAESNFRKTKSNQDEDSNDEGDADDDSSSNKAEPPSTDALALAANSARLQLDLLAQVCMALQYHQEMCPETRIDNEEVTAALESYAGAVLSLKKLVGDLLKMTKERDRHWRYKLGKEQEVRKLWEENMRRLVLQQEELEEKLGEERGKRKKVKRAAREVLREREHVVGFDELAVQEEEEKPIFTPQPQELSQALEEVKLDKEGAAKARRRSTLSIKSRSLPTELEISDSDSDDNDAVFFDALDAGEVEVIAEMPKSPPPELKQPDHAVHDPIHAKQQIIKPSFKGYEEPPRQRLKMDIDDRPKMSLWGILKSMIGKDMTKMTLPVSFNECTSLLQRVAEDMEYTELLDIAAERAESTERMVYVAAFAASEYSSTINRIAKPFNPLLGETFEYVRPDKGYRFFIEQVSHHPVIGAAWAEASRWDYWGESAVKSKFYGKSFDINPLGTWFLRLRPLSGNEELYTWKKVTTSVVGIMTGSPTVDNYGLMEIKNHTTGDVCILDFKQRGWIAASAYQVKGKVVDGNGNHAWNIGGRWNDKIYARRSLGSSDDGDVLPPGKGSSSAFLIWENHPRPPMPFNLTPFAVTLNALPEKLKPFLCPTDTRLRPDQRAMEDGEYDFAAAEKNRLEEKQRAKRREREARGEEWEPRWFKKSRCPVTGEEYWEHVGGYWKTREEAAQGKRDWNTDDIF